MARPRRLVLGLGNPLVGEDGFGSAVIELLRQRPDLSAAVDLVDAHTDLLAQVETLGSYDEVVLVDVVIGAGHPGDVAVVDEETFMRWPETSPSCHQISPLLAVKLFRALQPQAATRITLVALHADVVRAAPGVAASVVAAGGEAVVGIISMERPAPIRGQRPVT
jgi:hydrogenase maturation protease